jgi:hypothetical protein
MSINFVVLTNSNNDGSENEKGLNQMKSVEGKYNEMFKVRLES